MRRRKKERKENQIGSLTGPAKQSNKNKIRSAAFLQTFIITERIRAVEKDGMRQRITFAPVLSIALV